MVRHIALFNETAYKNCLINGMVLGSDGRKMSKSLGNYIATPEVFDKYGADAARQCAAGGGATGSDIPFRWSSVDYGWRFIIKLWNAARFVSLHLEEHRPQEEAGLELLDRWLLDELERVTQKVTEAFENFQFNRAMDGIRNFTWHVLCDCYIEATKHRLYKRDRGVNAVKHTLSTAIFRILQLLAPISPHITEEMYQLMFASEKGYRSVHLSPWPGIDQTKIDDETRRRGDLVVALIREIRKYKAEERMALNAPIDKLTVYAGGEESAEILAQAKNDVVGTCKVEAFKLLPTKGEGREVQGYPDVRFVVDR
jgi:valyl-tRNA synthetase